MYSLVYTTPVAIQSRTYLTKAELIETNREPIVGDLVYGSDSYYAQIVRVGEGIVEIVVIGQIANLQAVYDYVNSQLALTAKLAVSNVFTQPQQVPNATLPQHATNKLQVETMFEMFKRQLRGYNFAMPDLTNKTEISTGVYRLYNSSGVTIDYNINSGEYIVNGLSIDTIYFTPLSLLNNPYFISFYYVSGSFTSPAEDNISIYTIPFDLTNTIQVKNIDTFKNYSVPFNNLIIEIRNGQVFTNYTFKIQLEKGSTATPYTVPGQIPQYKIVGEA